MVRCARKKSVTGIYHVMLRGINRQAIFFEEEDNCRFIETLNRARANGGYTIYGYCLMGNHVHLLLHEQKEEIAVIMKRIGTSYARWYNEKYDRVGHVFQSRFKSEPVETEAYLLTVLRYIHNNPLKAKLAVRTEDYKWSSCQAYYREQDFYDGLTNTGFVLAILNSNREAAIKQFADFMQQENADQFMDFTVKQHKNDADLVQEIMKLLNGQPVSALRSLSRDNRNNLIRLIKEIEGVTQRQIARVTGIHQSVIFKI
ncbi:transposase [Sporomusa termitida]|uniref:Transposase IS200 like protein n=1 Tax=Sporomusa termitida TaxID=2377 RepID=A0A517DY93_9FIRM|nr:transposase [Sporomusa termitida]QDR82206.1 Transposase IS200 like protein [Sporomusa termitida]